jgi:hypothetical protein
MTDEERSMALNLLMELGFVIVKMDDATITVGLPPIK